MKIIPLTKESKQELLDTLAMRSTNAFAKQQEAVDAIVRDVRERGDEAVFALTEKFDGVRVTPDTLWVTQEEIDAAYAAIDPELLTVIREAAANIRDFHMRQRRNSWFDTKDGIILGQRVTPIAKVGVYVPGGRAVLSSSVLMNIIPAKVAGVPEIIMASPNGWILSSMTDTVETGDSLLLFSCFTTSLPTPSSIFPQEMKMY